LEISVQKVAFDPSFPQSGVDNETPKASDTAKADST
jgi:hypothetical protein